MDQKINRTNEINKNTALRLCNKYAEEYKSLDLQLNSYKKENNDSTIIHSTHHRPDYGATVLIEPFDETPLKFNEYLIKNNLELFLKIIEISQLLEKENDDKNLNSSYYLTFHILQNNTIKDNAEMTVIPFIIGI